ncbi:prepilin-type N-terminal cleavage/methylation domain-containing protein [bacterium]|nr:prepilin-type N-terminal cleavage/methylation domain-containing protein [bacterium]
MFLDSFSLKTVPRESKGFTMIEIMMVVALMGILVMIAVPKIGTGMRGAQTKTSIRRFAAVLRAARTVSVTHRSMIVAVVELGGNTCKFRIRSLQTKSKQEFVENSSQKSVSDNIPEVFTKPFVLDGDVKFLDFKFSEVGGVFDQGAVMFLPQGNSTGGVFILGMDDGPSYEVSIDHVTGRVHIDLAQ